MKLLLGDALDSIAPEALPADESQQVNWVNAVAETFFATGKWAGTIARWGGSNVSTSFALQRDGQGDHYATLPRNLFSILAGAYGDDGGSDTACFSSTPIRSHWHEFHANGFAAGNKIQATGISDAGDGYTTFRDFDDTAYLRVETDVDEADGAQMLLRGVNANGDTIYTGTGDDTIEGEVLDISSSPAISTTIFAAARPSLVKKSVTRGTVRLFSVDALTGVKTLIGIYAPGETVPSYRRYRIGACSDSTVTTLHALCKRRFVPAIADADEIIPGNTQALELGLMGRRFDLTNDTAAAAQYWLRAFALLNSELGEFQGGTTPRIQFERGLSLTGFPKVS